jgi:hypothetical protein
MNLSIQFLKKHNLYDIYEFKKLYDELIFLKNDKTKNKFLIQWKIKINKKKFEIITEEKNERVDNLQLYKYLHPDDIKDCKPNEKSCIYCFRYFCITCGHGVNGMYCDCNNLNCISIFKENELELILNCDIENEEDIKKTFIIGIFDYDLEDIESTKLKNILKKNDNLYLQQI